MFNFYVPGFIYRILPWVYIFTGIVSVIKLAGLLGTVSGLLLVVSGVLVLKWRAAGIAVKRSRTAARPRKPPTRLRVGKKGRTVQARRADQPTPRHSDAVPASSFHTTEADESSGPAKADEAGGKRSNPPEGGRLDRRGNTPDRRSWRPMPQTPFLDSKGVVVTKDRRKTPDRRKGNIVVEEL